MCIVSFVVSKKSLQAIIGLFVKFSLELHMLCAG